MERLTSVYAHEGAALAETAPPLTPEQIEAGARILATVEPSGSSVAA